MKYYSKEVVAEPVPRTIIYRYLKERNADRMDQVAIHYYGTDITFTNLFKRIDECARAFAALGVSGQSSVGVAVAVVTSTATRHRDTISCWW
jgi:non-ribosomal peptide synthetase component E (peptide arylation enzyme)